MSIKPTMQIVGVYPVDGVKSCYLIEALVHDALSGPDFAAITQPVLGVESSDWQVPYDEKLLDSDGTIVVSDLSFGSPPAWPSRARITFFFHHLDPDRPLATPFGEVALPTPTTRPNRLHWLNYEDPC